jgi:hypothetical protein
VSVLERRLGGSVALDFGITPSGAWWMQARNINDLSSNFPLGLNPNGGVVYVNTTTGYSWGPASQVIQVGAAIAMQSFGPRAQIAGNLYYNGATWVYSTSGFGWVQSFDATTGDFTIFSAPTGTAGTNAGTLNAMMLVTPYGELRATGIVTAKSLQEKVQAQYGGPSGTCDWSYGGTQFVTDQPMNVAFANIPPSVLPQPSPLVSHFVSCSNFNQLTWPGTVNWGAGGKPSIAGAANIVLSTIDGGSTVWGTVVWRNV